MSLLLVVGEALVERARLRARGLIVDGICADNVCRSCSHCFREVVDLDIVWAQCRGPGWCCGYAQIGEELELLRRLGKPRRSELASPLSMVNHHLMAYVCTFLR